jgi:hypothetical protein
LPQLDPISLRRANQIDRAIKHRAGLRQAVADFVDSDFFEIKPPDTSAQAIMERGGTSPRRSRSSRLFTRLLGPPTARGSHLKRGFAPVAFDDLA